MAIKGVGVGLNPSYQARDGGLGVRCVGWVIGGSEKDGGKRDRWKVIVGKPKLARLAARAKGNHMTPKS